MLGNALGGRTPWPVFAGNLGAMVASLLLRGWMRRGRVQLASIGLMAVGFILITASVASLGTVRVPATAMYLLLVITAGLLFDLRGMVATTALCSLAVGGLIVAENAGLLPRPDYAVTITQWVAYTAICGWTGSLTLAALRALRQVLTRAEREVTTRVQAESQRETALDELRAAKNLVDKTFASLTDAVFVVEPATRTIVACNPAVEQIFGYSSAELLGRTTEFLHVSRETFAEFGRQLFPALDRCGRFQCEFQMRRKGGSVFPTEHIVTEIMDAAGKRTGVVSVVRDVTERKQAESKRETALAALRESEERYRALVEHSADGILLTVPDGRILAANPAACRMFGRTEAEICQGGRAGLLDATDPRLQAGLAERARTGRFSGELTFVRRDGARFPGEVSTVIFQAQDGAPRTSMVIRDITERKRAEEALRHSEVFLNNIIEHSPHATWISDDKGTLIRLNQACRDLLHIKDDEVVGKYNVLEDSIVREQGYLPLVRQVFEKGETARFSLEYDSSRLQSLRLEETTIVILDVTISAVLDASGRVTNAIIQHVDITERSRAEEALYASREQLRALTGYLQTAREAERATIAREIHDEFGQALTAFKMDLSWLARRLPQRRGAELAAKVSAMSGLIDGAINTVRRIATELRPGLLDDLGLIAAIEWQAEEFADRTGIACDLRLGDQGIPLDRDLATALFRIFQEALTNVARHAEATTVTVELKESPAELTLVVADNGRGIAPDRVTAPHSLGLLGMRERAREWGGDVAFEVAAGQGTTVTVRIPRGKDL
jgi:PAS domain S-box-containing protein